MLAVLILLFPYRVFAPVNKPRVERSWHACRKQPCIQRSIPTGATDKTLSLECATWGAFYVHDTADIKHSIALLQLSTAIFASGTLEMFQYQAASSQTGRSSLESNLWAPAYP